MLQLRIKNNKLNMKSNSINIKKALYIIIPLLIIALIVFRLKSNKEKTDSKVYTYNKEQALNVTTEKITLQPIGSDFVFTGTFEPNRESKLSAEQQGKINAIYCDLGSYVTKGQKLVQLDNALLQQQLKSINIQINGLELDVKRYTILSGADAIQGVQLEKANIGLQTANAQKSLLLEQINKTSIYAPFGGVITAKLSEIGSFAAPGVPILQLSEVGTLRFIINVSEKDLPFFKVGQSKAIQIDALPDNKIQGRVTMVGSKSNMGNSFPVQFSVQNISGNSIKAGMFGKVSMDVNSDEMGIVIPASVLSGTADQPLVYIVKEGKAKLTNITISKRTNDKVVVSEGLQQGDILITNGFVNLFDGANVGTIKN